MKNIYRIICKFKNRPALLLIFGVLLLLVLYLLQKWLMVFFLLYLATLLLFAVLRQDAALGFEAPDAGRLHLDGVDVTNSPAEARAFGMVFQGYALFPHLTVAQNIAFPLQVQRRSAADIRARTAQMIAMWAWTDTRTSAPAPCRAASNSAWHWPVRWPMNPRFCCWMSRFRR